MITIFTPVNNAQWLPDVYESLLAQTDDNLEWIILENGDANLSKFRDLTVNDRRVRFDGRLRGISLPRVGALKQLACREAHGFVLLELDQDDLLAPTAIEKVAAAFADPEVDFAYSNACYVNEDWSLREEWNERYGWHYRDTEIYGHKLRETISPEPHAQNLRSILFSPDHLRAWRRTSYREIGGHDQSLAVGDDHDLVIRTYLKGSKMVHLNAPLYIYRVHGANHWLSNISEIDQQSWTNWERYKFQIATKWAQDHSLECIDLCGAIDTMPGFKSLDRDGDIKADLNGEWPLADNSVGVIRAFDAFEHLREPLHTMNEVYRVLAHGGFVLSITPSSDGRGAFCDPTHVSFWNELSFRYYTQAQFSRYIKGAGSQVRFQQIRVRTYNENLLPYVGWDAIAIKWDHPRFHGELLI